MKLLKRLIISILLIVLIFGVLLTYKGYEMYKEAVSKISLEAKIEEIRSDDYYIKIDALPNEYLIAVVDVEDHRFYDHNGIDIVSISRALVNNIKAKEVVEGGSTITQQLAKNMYFTQKKELVRKIAELFLVFDLEENYEKDDILELYVNTSYFGDGYYGIGQASRGYLNKEPIDMTLSECTLLAGIPNAPSVYAPTKNPDLAVQRQKHVINRMVEKGDLSEEEAKKLLQELE